MLYVLFFGAVMIFLSVVAWRDQAQTSRRHARIQQRDQR
jgi:hypothetical protein